MKKIYLIVQKKDMVASLEGLRGIGVVHVEPVEESAGSDLLKIREEVNVLSQGIDILKVDSWGSEQIDVKDWTETVNEILFLQSQVGHFQESIARRQIVINQYAAWGNFEPKDFDVLKGKGVFAGLYELPEKEKSKIPAGAIVYPVSSLKGILRCVLVSQTPFELPFTKILLPEMSLDAMNVRQEEEKLKIEEAQTKIKEHYCYFHAFQKILGRKIDELRLEEVAVGMKEDQGLVFLKGFCPINLCKDLEVKAKEHQWGMVIEDPSEEDRVPTLIKNPKWVEIIKPLFTLINVLPGYKEVDISPIFLVFFSIFFGILIGDAGYGIIFFGLTLFLQNKFKLKVKDKAPFFLMYVLSASAIIWGLLTGTFFGTLLLGKMVKPIWAWLTDSGNVQLVCFLIGAVHLTIARGWQLLMKMSNFFSAMAEFGWIVVVWGGFFLANAMVIGKPIMGMDITKCLTVIGAGVGIVFVDIIIKSKGRIGDIGIGFILLFFSTLSACTDVVSYIRLFAVGLAGLAVADAFNEMALGIGFNGVLAGLMTSLILIGGHLFNIVLSCFGLLVHGLRLNVLEFSGHLGLEWKGFKYQPFKKTEIVSV
ncbi:MAG: hypothetical protein Q7S13_01495 [Candidatus Omnitrophota bacterium]|nr:hypothetical protein [Candidatus Omnitrophota bacterium]